MLKKKPVIRYRIFYNDKDERKVYETTARNLAVDALKRLTVKGAAISGATMQAATDTPGGWREPIDINQEMWLAEAN